MKAALANRLWLLNSRRAAKDFHYAANHVAESQSRLLQSYLEQNKNTAYLKQYFPTPPLSTYENYIPYIERIADGEQNILTRDPVQLFELSSGSTAATKMIPYTRALKREFGLGLSTWIHDLYTHHPELMAGPAYWSISPLTDGLRQTNGGIPIGFEEDSEYLGPLGAIIKSALAVPNIVKHIRDVTAFRYVTLFHLLRCADLRLISVWNPTFLTLLLQPLSLWWDSLLRDIANGNINPPVPIEESLVHSLQPKLKPDPNRARALSQINPDDYVAIWRQLKLISCWADGPSANYARDLQERFPGILIQPKGLLATEAFVSFPLISHEGGALAVTSHYFEFLNSLDDIFPAHQLEKGKTYSVVVTTGGGLYRYQLNDLVEVIGFYGQVPCLKFLGKADRASDYFGEKLNEQFVENALLNLFAKHNLCPVFYMLAPEDTDDFHYTLYIELPSYAIAQLPKYIITELDAVLRENFHYDYCRKLGQLAETQAILVTRGAESYIKACQARGQKLGNIKPSALQKSTGWGAWFS